VRDGYQRHLHFHGYRHMTKDQDYIHYQPICFKIVVDPVDDVITNQADVIRTLEGITRYSGRIWGAATEIGIFFIFNSMLTVVNTKTILERYANVQSLLEPYLR